MNPAELQEVRNLLCEGLSDSAIKRRVDCPRAAIRQLRKEMLICKRCAEPLREVSPLCGFCKGELREEAAA